jgi:hypothetical protein
MYNCTVRAAPCSVKTTTRDGRPEAVPEPTVQPPQPADSFRRTFRASEPAPTRSLLSSASFDPSRQPPEALTLGPVGSEAAAGGRSRRPICYRPARQVNLSVPEKLIRSGSNVFDDLAEQERRDVAAAVGRNSRTPTVWMSELLVGTSLPDLLETHLLEDRDDLSRTQDG